MKYETTFAVLTRFDQRELDALKKWMEEVGETDQGLAVRRLTADYLKTMGLLDHRK